jgi:hypothetical protein
MKKFLIGLGVFILLLVVLNFLLEPIALRVVNKELSKLEGYSGSVEDIDIALWRGAYVIEGMRIEKTGSKAPEPFFGASAIDISVQWAALFQGAIVAEVILENPTLNFAVQPSTGEVQTGGDNDWVQTVKNLVPIQINRFELVNAEIFYRDPTSDPKVVVTLNEFNLVATNLNNASDNEALLPSHISARGNTSGNGKLAAEVDLNALKESPDFDLTLNLDHLELTYLKDFTDAYANFTFKGGELFVSSEIAMKDGAYNGYVKPVLENVSVIDLQDESSNFWRKVWEVIIGGTLEAFTNQRTEKFATKVPISGNVNDSEVGILSSIANVIQNAFINAFNNKIEGSINIEDAKKKGDKGFFEELFDNDGEDKSN